MKTVLAKVAGTVPILAILFVCSIGAIFTNAPGAPSAPGLSTVTTILWLLGLGGAICLLLRQAIHSDDRSRELAAQLARESGARQFADSLLLDTQAVLSRVVRQQDMLRDGERDRIASNIHDELGQTLLALRVELSLLQVASNGIHPTVHQKTSAMVGTLDLALRSLRVVVNGLRPLNADECLDAAMARQLDEFTRLTGITHTLDAAAGSRDGTASGAGTDTLLYRVLQETLANISSQASATAVRVSLQRGGAQLTLQIDDDGVGTDEPGVACACGLSSMRHRISALGGKLVLATSPGCGNKLTLNLPIQHGIAAA